jgi:hypothetical protein
MGDKVRRYWVWHGALHGRPNGIAEDTQIIMLTDYVALESKLTALVDAVKRHLEVKQLTTGGTTTGYVCYDPALSEALALAQTKE